MTREEMVQRTQEWRRKNPEKYAALNRRRGYLQRDLITASPNYYEEIKAKARKKTLAIKMAVVSHYTNGKNSCQCCGESNIVFLTIDHIIPIRGAENRPRGPLGSFIVKNNFPEGFQILCFNCNMAKGVKLGCPHKTIGK